MTGNPYVSRSSRVAARMLGDELMIMSASDSSLYVLNDTAATIWNAADGTLRLDEIVIERVCVEFDVGVAEALSDAEKLVAELAQAGILVVSEQPVGEGL